MLRLVPPPRGEGQDPPRRKGKRSAALSLATDERQHLRAALGNLRRAFGTWACLADAMRVPVATLAHAGRRGSAALALRAARVAGVSVESVLTGALADVARCKACGHKPGDGRIALAANGGAP